MWEKGVKISQFEWEVSVESHNQFLKNTVLFNLRGSIEREREREVKEKR